MQASEKAVAVVLAVALALGMADVLRLVTFFVLYKPINWDSLVYLTIGRGLLNGMKPYTGLFEMKPPGIFLISAASLATTGNEYGAVLLQAAMHLAIPVLIAWTGGKILRDAPPRLRAFGITAAATFGCIISMTAVFRHGAFQTEAFGFFFTLIYVASIALPGPMGRKRIVWATLGMMGAVGMKEPFILPLLASALVLHEARKPFWKTFIIPLLITGVVGVLLLIVLGYFSGYVQVYLPYIFSTRLAQGLPLPLRGLAIGQVLLDFFVWPMPLLGLLVGLLLYTGLTDGENRLPSRRTLLCVAGAVLILTLVWCATESVQPPSRYPWEAADFYRIRNAVRLYFSLPEHAPLRTIFLAGLSCTAAGLLLLLIPRGSRRPGASLLAALFLVTLAAGMGGFFSSYYTFSLPLVCALFFRFIDTLRLRRSPIVLESACAVLLLCTLLFSSQSGFYAYLTQETRLNSDSTAELTHAFDGIMKACHLRRYFIIGDGAAITAYSRFSPVGPIPFQLPAMPDLHPMLLQYYERGVNTAQVAVVTELGRNRDSLLTLFPQAKFTTVPPSCAGPYLQPLKAYTVYFRMKWDGEVNFDFSK